MYTFANVKCSDRALMCVCVQIWSRADGVFDSHCDWLQWAWTERLQWNYHNSTVSCYQPTLCFTAAAAAASSFEWWQSTGHTRSVLSISAPSLGVYYFLSLTLSVCLSVCHKHCFFFVVSQRNPAISWPSVFLTKTTKLFLRFLICCHGYEIWAIFAKISNCFFFFLFSDGIEPFFEC